MKLKALKVANFRSYGVETTLDVGDLTAIIGRNDVGKSTLLEAMEAFFNGEIVKIGQGDSCVHNESKVVEISCVFDELPTTLTIDAQAETSLAAEYLVSATGDLEIVKRYDCSVKSVKEEVLARALHPSAEGASDLLKLKNAGLKERATSLGVDLNGVNKSSNVQLRSAIRNHVGDLQLTETLISLKEEDGKKAWEQIQRSLPIFALFQADRPSKDDDPEVSDPMKIAVQAAVREVEAELEAIKQKVQASALEVAQRTIQKLAEMDPSLAGQLNPTFKAEPKWDSFKLTLTGDDDIPINKRGSGVRRLILLNFFRAEAERRRQAAESRRIIYAIEEPESSQHPDNQVMLMKSLLDLSNDSHTQVLLTTHVPSVAAQIPVESVRFITRDGDNRPLVEAGTDEVYSKVVESLGVLPDKRAKVAIYIEGPHDYEFLTRASAKLRPSDATLIDIETDHRVAWVVTGGGNLKHWVDKQYLANAQLVEVHIYDRDDQTNPKYQAQVDAINARGDGSIAFLTTKREMENYVHPAAISAELGIQFAHTDWCDVPALFAEQVHIASGSPNAWANLADDLKSSKESKAKKKLNTIVLDRMSAAELEQQDGNGEVRSWLEHIRDRVQ